MTSKTEFHATRRDVMAKGAALTGTAVAGFATPAWADASKAQVTVDRAKATVTAFAADSKMEWLTGNISNAKAIMVLPSSLQGGFIFGGSGGNGVLLARGSWVDGWSYPAFYTMGSVSFGLQIGGQVSEIVLMIMTDRGIDRLLTSTFKLGGDVSVAAGPVGAQAKAQTVDVLAFARTKGLYGGINIEGAVIKIRNGWNEAYYQTPGVRPRDILVSRSVSNPGANELRRSLADLAR